MELNPDFWYRLDNVGKVFAPIASKKSTTVFRIAVTLKEPINVVSLQTALDRIMTRFPYFQVNLRPGFFWYYLERTDSPQEVSPDSRYPCEQIPIRRKGSFLFRIKVYRNRIAAEFSHALTDGSGVLTFLKALVAEYIDTVYGSADEWGDLFRPGQTPDPEETEDAFLKYYRKDAPPPKNPGTAFHLPMPNLERGVYHVVTGIVRLMDVLKSCREMQVTINDFLTAVLFDAYQDVYFAWKNVQPGKTAGPIRILVPINLKKLFPTKTMRNFILYTLPEIDPRLGRYDFSEILTRVHHFIRMETNPKSMQPAMGRNVRGEKYLAVRIVPRMIKDLFLLFTHYRIGEKPVSTSLSNLGIVTMPEKIAGHIEGFDFIPAPGPVSKCNCGVISFGDRIRISFGRTVQEADVERYFFRKLVRLGIPVKIQSN